MKRPGHGSKIKKSTLVSSGIALLLALSITAAVVLPSLNVLPPAAADGVDSGTPSEGQGDELILSLGFEGGEINNLLPDSEDPAVPAKLVNNDVIGSTDDGKKPTNSYLDLTKTDAYLSLEGSVLNGLTEMTVEMRVKTKDSIGPNWAFFAAQNAKPQAEPPTYLGVLLKDNKVKVERFANGRENENFYGNFSTNAWHTIRVVFAGNSTTLYIDGEPVQKEDSTKQLKDCIGENGIFWFGRAAWVSDKNPNGEGFNGFIDDIKIWKSADDQLNDENLIASFDFEGNDDNEKLSDKSKHDVVATNDGGEIAVASFDKLFTFDEPTEPTYLDLTDKDISLSIDNDSVRSSLQNLTEMTVEMNIKMDDLTGPNWPFFAAPNGEYPGESPTYLGILLDSGVVKVQRFSDGRTTEPHIEWPVTGGWHRIRVVFAANSTMLYVDNEIVKIGTNNYTLKDCLGKKQGDTYTYDKSVLWFGYSSWGEYFDGCIRDISIWDYANYDDSITDFEKMDEDQHITTEHVIDNPKNTTVNMFDYWITERLANDYEALEPTRDENGDIINHNDLLEGINKDHLFLFAGEQAFGGGPLAQAIAEEIGFWNRSTGPLGDNGELKTTNEITQGIVQRTLGKDGYPALALNKLVNGWKYPSNDAWKGLTNEILKDLWEGTKAEGKEQAEGGEEVKIIDKKTESLAYLFDPNTEDTKIGDDHQAGKASYPNVTGLFRLNDEGYYVFRSWDTFAELNKEQGDKYGKDSDNNHITLYDKPWGWGLANFGENRIDEKDGQFFPFNDWSDMFFIDQSGNAVQAHINDTDKGTNGSGQTATDEPLNHYFGMTVETTFQQPIDGKLDNGNPMIFDFSGDDDVWIFIDDVLVGDLGGVHGWKTISIDFSTGDVLIGFGSERKEDGTFIISHYPKLCTTLEEMFDKAGKKNIVDWKEINITNPNTSEIETYEVFSDNSVHTLKFFYLERGNQFSNCNITFNLQSVQPDVILKVDENGEPLKDAVFELYAAEPKPGKVVDTAYSAVDFKIADDAPDLIAHVITGEDGRVEFRDEDDNPIGYAHLEKHEYYILEETTAPPGYRKNEKIILKLDSNTRTFTVVNKYETGAYASFSAYLTQFSNGVHLATYNENNKQWDKYDSTVTPGDLQSGIAFIVPTEWKNDRWYPMYGSNAAGWDTVMPSADTEAAYIPALLQAVLKQLKSENKQLDSENGRFNSENTPNFSMMLDTKGILTANLYDLPGSANRYMGKEIDDLDLSYATLFVPYDILYKGKDILSKLQNDENTLTLDDVLAVLEDPEQADGLKLLYTGSKDFERIYVSDIHIADMPQQLVVRKVDANGKPLEGAEFALYNDPAKAYAGKAEDCLIKDTTGDDGMLILDGRCVKDGSGEIVGLSYGRCYWLREIKAPAGYLPNDYLIKVVVDEKGYVYADATAFEYDSKKPEGEKTQHVTSGTQDNVNVYAAVGNLAQSVVRFTNAENVYKDQIILTDISVVKEKAAKDDPTSAALTWGAKADENLPELHYYGQEWDYSLLDFAAKGYNNKTNPEELLYALGVVKEGDGFVRVRPVHGTLNMSPMFSMLNIVEVIDNVGIGPAKTEESPGDGKTVKPGETITYKITWENNSPNNATLTITDPLDEKVDFVSAKYGTVPPLSAVKEDGKVKPGNIEQGNVKIEYVENVENGERSVIWTIKEVPPYTSVEVFLEVKVNDNITDDKSIENYATLTNSNIKNGDTEIIYTTDIVENPVIKLDIEKTQALSKPGEAVTKEASTKEMLIVKPGDSVVYYLTVTVKGTKDEELENIVVQDMVPKGLELVKDSIFIEKPEREDYIIPDSAIPAPSNYQNETQIIKWNLGTGKAGDTFTLGYTVKIPSDGSEWKNIAYVASGNSVDQTYPGTPGNPDASPRAPWKPSDIVELYKADPVSCNLPSVNKKLTNRDWIEGLDVFSFELSGYDDDTKAAIKNGGITIANDLNTVEISKEHPDTAPAFGEITFNTVGTFRFSVTEVKGTNGSIQYDPTEYVITVQVVIDDENKCLKIDGDVTVTKLKDANTDIKDGTTSIVTQESKLEFNNIYSAKGSWPPSVKKEISGRLGTEDDEFEFVLELDGPDGVDKSAVEIPENLKIKGDKITDSSTFDFDDVIFTKPGIYTFKLSEKAPENGDKKNGLIFDKGYYKLTVNVIDALNSELNTLVDVTFYEYDGADGIAYSEEEYLFTNKYSASTTLLVPIEKVLKGRDWKENEKFEFTIEPESDTDVDANADADADTDVEESFAIDKGAVYLKKDSPTDSFELTFTSNGSEKTTYTFIIAETINDEADNGDMTYAKPYKLEVEVTDDMKGNMTAVVTNYPDGANKLTFTNQFTAAGVLEEGAITVYKELTGRDWDDNDKFTFNIAPFDDKTKEAMEGDDKLITFADDKYEITIGKTDEADGDGNRFASFGNIIFKANGKTGDTYYRFQVTESGDNLPQNVSSDNSVYIVKVKVTDDNSGTLKAEVVRITKKGEGKAKDTILFVNEYKAPQSLPNTVHPTDPMPADPPPDPPATSDDLFNLGDDGLPKGDKDLDDDGFDLGDDGLPKGDLNMDDPNKQTGVSPGGSLYIALGTLLLAAAAVTVKRRHDKKNK